MKSLGRIVLILGYLGLLAGGAAAQQHDDYVFAMGSVLDADRSAGIDDGNGVLLGAGWMLGNPFNIEAVFQHSRTDGSPYHRHTTIGADLQWLLMRESAFSPYLFVGGGYMKVNSDNQGSDPGAVLNGGAGFRANIFGDSRVSLRGEYRLRDYDAYGQGLNDGLWSLGIQIPFGDPAPRSVDSDGDGIDDNRDRCPGTPAGTVVGPDGCEPDGDADGVVDSADQCPNTPRGATVDSRGCELDSDGDGVADSLDQCPDTVAGAEVGTDGCELDSDNDGVVDRLDECPGTAEGAAVDVKGCELRAEIRLPGVNFESNSDRLVPGASGTLNDAIATLRMNPDIRIEVAGHTDSDGAAEYNEGLSARRAATVRDYLVRGGIDADRISSRGYGESQPIATNDTAEGKASNRRVVLRIIEE